MTHKITREYEKKMSEISPFELKNILIDPVSYTHLTLPTIRLV